MGLRLAKRVLLVVLALSGLPACEVDRSAIPPPDAAVTAVPEFVCAGEDVTVSWDAGDQIDSPACRPGLVGTGGPSRSECIFVARTSMPAHSAWDGTGDDDTRGSRTATIATTTTFTATATKERFEGSGSATVTVIEQTEPPGPTTLPFQFQGTCDGAMATWEGVQLKDRTSGCLEVLAVCNSGSERIRLTDVDDPSRTAILETSGDCTETFNGRAPNLRGAIEGYAAPPGVCGAERTAGGPPSLGINVRLQCNRDMPTCAF